MTKDALTEVIVKLAKICKRLGVRMVFIGGIAVNIYARPRTTYDVDGVISLDESNIKEFASDAGRAGFKYDGKKPVKFIQGMPFMSLFYPKLKTYVDLFLGQSDFQKSLLARAKRIRFHNESINIVAPEDLILSKLIYGRERDIEDVREIITEGLKK